MEQCPFQNGKGHCFFEQICDCGAVQLKLSHNFVTNHKKSEKKKRYSTYIMAALLAPSMIAIVKNGIVCPRMKNSG